MAKKSMIVKQQKEQKFKTREYNRCKLCGRPHGYIRKKHVKPRKQGDEGGIISVECGIHSSKVNVVCSKCNKPARIGYKMEKDGKVRVCKKCGTIIK